MSKSVFEMTPEELRGRLQPVAEELQKQAFDTDGFITYRDDRCRAFNEFIKQYLDGSEELVRLENRQYVFVKRLS